MATDSRNVDYATKYKKELDQAFSEDSLTEKYVTQEESFKEDGGVASVYFRTVDTSDFLAGHTGPTFSAPDAVASDVVRKDVTLFYQINKVIASVSVDDTAGAMDAAGEILTTGIRERYAPFMDKLRMATAIAAANGYGGANVVAYNSADIMGGIDSMIATLKNNRSYSKTQALFIPASVEPELDTELFSIYAPNKNDWVSCIQWLIRQVQHSQQDIFHMVVQMLFTFHMLSNTMHITQLQQVAMQKSLARWA